MKEAQLLKISCAFWTIAMVVGIVISVVDIIQPLPMFTHAAFEGYVGESWSTFAQEYPKHAALYEHFDRVGSCVYVVLLIHVLFILFFAYRYGRRWAWVCMLIGVILDGGTSIVFAALFEGPRGTIPWIVCFALGLAALLLPAKAFWGAQSQVQQREPQVRLA